MIRYSAYRMPRLPVPIAPKEPKSKPKVWRSTGAGQPSTWTAEDDARLLELRAGNVPFRTIAEQMGRSANGCCQRYNRLKGNVL